MLKPNDDHAFAVPEQNLFVDTTQWDLRMIKCDVCHMFPGQGVHVPPKPPLSRTITDEVAKKLAATRFGRDNLGFQRLASQASFAAILRLREWLEEFGNDSRFSDAEAVYAFDRIDDELDKLLTELRKFGWDDQDRS